MNLNDLKKTIEEYTEGLSNISHEILMSVVDITIEFLKSKNLSVSEYLEYLNNQLDKKGDEQE